MNCIIPGPNLKVFAKALHALAKIGDSLYIEATDDGLFLMTLNLRKTICVRFYFSNTFFSSYEVNINADDEEKTVFCKMQLKIILPLFKGNYLDKKLDFVKIHHERNSDETIFKMKYKSDDIIMSHNLRLMELETLSMKLSTDSGTNNLLGSSLLFSQISNSFSGSNDDIIFEVSPQKVFVRNYYVGSAVKPMSVRSQIKLYESEFITYKIDVDTSISFSLKPLKTAVQFAETFDLNVSLNFDKGGRPLALMMNTPTYNVNFIIATADPYNNFMESLTVSSCAPTKGSNIEKSLPLTLEEKEAFLDENWDNFDDDSKLDQNGTLSRRSPVISREKFDSENNNDKSRSESPKTKKARILFGRCLGNSFTKSSLGEILAPDSDPESTN